MKNHDIIFNIEDTLDGEHYVVQANWTGEDDGWVDLTKDFDSFVEAEAWARKLKEKFVLLTDIPF